MGQQVALKTYKSSPLLSIVEIFLLQPRICQEQNYWVLRFLEVANLQSDWLHVLITPQR